MTDTNKPAVGRGEELLQSLRAQLAAADKYVTQEACGASMPADSVAALIRIAEERKRQLAERDAQRDKDTREIGGLLNIISERNNEIATLTGKLAEREKEIERLREVCTGYRDTIAVLTRELKVMRAILVKSTEGESR